MIFLTLKYLLIWKKKNLYYFPPFTICNLWVWLSFLVFECLKTQMLIKLSKPSVTGFKCWKWKRKHMKSYLKVVSVNVYIRSQCISLSIFTQFTFLLKTKNKQTNKQKKTNNLFYDLGINSCHRAAWIADF